MFKLRCSVLSTTSRAPNLPWGAGGQRERERESRRVKLGERFECEGEREHGGQRARGIKIDRNKRIGSLTHGFHMSYEIEAMK